MNIVSMGMKYLGPAVATKVADMLGIKSPMVVKMIAAGLPTVLAMLSSKASSGQGASALMDMIKGQDISSPDQLDAMLSKSSVDDLAAGGGLSDLLGRGDMDTLTGAFSKYGGLPETASKSILGLIAPAALGSLKNEVDEGGLDAGGLAGLLSSQKDNIAGAMPQDFADQLSGTGLLSAINGDTAAPINEAATTATKAVEAKSSGGMLKWLVPVVAVLGLGWYFLGGSAPETPDLSEIAAGADLTVGDVNLGEQVGSITDNLSSTFGGITDAASAEAAIPGLEAASEELGQVGELAGQLPEAAQGAFGGLMGTALSTLQPMIENLLGSSEYGSILQPILEPMLAKLTELAG